MRRMMEVRRRRVPDVQVEGRRVRARVLLQHARAEGAGRRLVRRRHLEPEPRRPRSAQGLRGVPRRRQPQGPADGHPRQDDQGLRHGRVRRGAEHHAPAEEDVGRFDPRASATASASRCPTTSSRKCRTSTFAEGSPELEYMRARRMELGGYLPARRRKARAAAGARARGVRAVPQEHRRARDLDDDGVRADPADAAARQEHRQAHRADRPRRVAHVRHGGHVPPARHLEPARPALHAAGRRPADVLQGEQGRPDPAGRHQRGRRRCATGSPRRRATRRTACR